MFDSGFASSTYFLTPLIPGFKVTLDNLGTKGDNMILSFKQFTLDIEFHSLKHIKDKAKATNNTSVKEWDWFLSKRNKSGYWYLIVRNPFFYLLLTNEQWNF